MPAEKLDKSVLNTFPQLETDRLVLQEIGLADARALFEIFSNLEVTITTDIYPLKSLAEAESMVVFMTNQFNYKSGLRWGITLKGEDKVVGTCGYNFFDERGRRGEIGYDLARSRWGKGIVTEAVSAIVRFGFDKIRLNRIEATTNLDNVASMRVLDKLGFKEEGILRQYGYWRRISRPPHVFPAKI
jgi:ribosomal-protein-alanine N-acetyltransferase